MVTTGQVGQKRNGLVTCLTTVTPASLERVLNRPATSWASRWAVSTATTASRSSFAAFRDVPQLSGVFLATAVVRRRR